MLRIIQTIFRYINVPLEGPELKMLKIVDFSNILLIFNYINIMDILNFMLKMLTVHIHNLHIALVLSK